ncbi:hypothetical protein Emag_000005 [Eimeria magna]
MSRKLYRWVGVADSHSHTSWSSRVMHRPWRLAVLLFGGFLLLFCTAAATLATQVGVAEEAAVTGTDNLQEAAYKDAGIIGVRRPSPPRTPLDQQLSADPQENGRSGEKAVIGPELAVQFRQVSRDSLKQRWVELRVEILGTDGKPNAAYDGNVKASLILAEPEDRDDLGTLKGQGDGDSYTEKAVDLNSSFAVKGTGSRGSLICYHKGMHESRSKSREVSLKLLSQYSRCQPLLPCEVQPLTRHALRTLRAGIAVLLFSPPIDGAYRFSVTCGGCKKRVMTEKHQLAAGAQAFLKVISQPSGGTSGTVLKQQPAVQIINRNGGPLNQKATIVATLISASDGNLEAVTPKAWTFETDEEGYGEAKNLSISSAGRQVIRFATTLWEDTRLEVSSIPFEIVAGPAVSAVFSLKPPSPLLLREPFSVVITLLDAHGNETTSPPETHKEGQAVVVSAEAFDESGNPATCLLCTKAVADSAAVVQAISTARVHVYPIPLLIERLSVGGSKDDPPPTDNWGQLRVSLRAENWKFEAPQHPVIIEPWSPGVLVGSEELSPPSSEVFIGAFSIQLHVISKDPAWSSSPISFDSLPPSFLQSLTSIRPQDAKSVVVYAKDSDTRELLLSFPNSQLVREGEKDLSEKGIVTGNSIRAVILQHSVATSRADNEWLVRGGHEVTFSVWDDDVPGVRTPGHAGSASSHQKACLAQLFAHQAEVDQGDLGQAGA